jgi:hypothetical protein
MRPDAFNLGDIIAKNGDFDAKALIDLLEKQTHASLTALACELNKANP